MRNEFVKDSQNLTEAHSLVHLYANSEIRCADLGRSWNRDDIVEREIELETCFK